MQVETLNHLFAFNLENYNKPDLLTYRGLDNKYYKISTNEFKIRVVNFALGLRTLGVKKGTKVLLLSENRPEWPISDFACHLLGAIVVPVFPTLIPEQLLFIGKDSGSRLAIASVQAQVDKIQEIRQRLPELKTVISMENIPLMTDVIAFSDVLAEGREEEVEGFWEKGQGINKPDDIATIIYTSGTTGRPKGVLLSHENFVSNCKACCERLHVGPTDKGLSFLPLSHAFERTVDYIYFYAGASIVYTERTDEVATDLVNTSPTIVAAVPRFYEKVKSKIEARAAESGGLKKLIFEWAVGVGMEIVEKTIAQKKVPIVMRLKWMMADRLVFKKIRERTGGNVRYFISGGAPLSAEIAKFFFAAGLTILEGYGLTETSPVVALNPLDRPKFGSVGPILEDVEVKVADDGEVLVKGPNVMQGYYKLPEATNEVLSDGWFRTGDIGALDEDGYLYITDRKKQLIVTSVGKKVAPQPIEKELENSPYLEQVLLLGDDRRFISALVVPDFDRLRRYAQDNGIAQLEPQALVQNDKILALIQAEIDKEQKHLSDYEKVRKFSLLPEAFSVENGQLTPTMKIVRRKVEECYSNAIEEMYRSE